MMGFLSELVAVTLVSSVLQTCAITSCPRIVKVEKGTNYSITCTAETNVNDFYWYKGPATDHDLVGKLENGTKSISDRYKDDYDVSLLGGLVILNAGINHESRYDLVTFDANGNPEEERVIVNITISPDIPCPLISNCTSCEHCKLPQTKKSGTLTCKVEGSRPQVPLKWKTVSQSGISVLAYRPEIQQSDASTDSWDSSVSLEYKITVPCEAKIVLQCVAEDTQQILNSTVSKIEISTDQCDTIPINGTSPPVMPPLVISPSSPPVISPTSPSSSPAVVIILTTLFIVLLIGFILLIVIYRCKRNKNAGQIVRLLKDKYKQFCYLQPLPWGKGIHIAALYTDNNCTVTDKSGISSISSNELRTPKSIMSQRLVIFMGEHGGGRTTFLKQVVYEWTEGVDDIFLLIFIPLKDVQTDKTLSKYLIEDIPVLKTSKFKTGHVEAILQDKDKHCLVILDGLEDLPESFRNGIGDTGNQTEDARNLVTIGELIQGKRHWKYSNLHVWISSREADCASSWCPKDYVKVEMERFSKDQFTTYIRKCCVYYVSYIQGEERKEVTYVPSKDSTSEIMFQQEETTKENNEVLMKVQNFLEENNVLRDYENSPLLINLMIHILAAKYTSAYGYLNDVEISNMTTLLRIVIYCMKERYVNKNPSFSTKDFNDLVNKLGEVALQERANLGVKDSKFWDKEIGEKNVKPACKIGLLKLTKDSPSTAKFSGIEFQHLHIQEYLAASYILSTGKCISNYEQILEQCGEEKVERIKKIFSELRNPILNVL
ncbi:hypothetical protein HOLleu_22642 [Holothuria leucospilota]|uniref:Ig-like domain-containing protein n=1 Tax=Holothuria leucospilota TaxID=206669 RepID=A0A9Q1BXW4_HOLLE|nr:hypothetical protein HOLleu_22642 [Holothuria leucospilota]